MTKLKKLLNLWLPVIVWTGLIFYLSSIPDLRTSLSQFWDTVLRKIAHMAEFCILFLLLFRALDDSSKKRGMFWALLFSILYAFSDEWHQKFVFGRVSSLIDVGIDSFGAIIGYMIKTKSFSGVAKP
ncbi:MAG: VanZ family protein [Patescibacteria group bacterium]|jgi:VanZ family protein|nr:VanZ family protein [Patescibacteria group bacterium]